MLNSTEVVQNIVDDNVSDDVSMAFSQRRKVLLGGQIRKQEDVQDKCSEDTFNMFRNSDDDATIQANRSGYHDANFLSRY